MPPTTDIVCGQSNSAPRLPAIAPPRAGVAPPRAILTAKQKAALELIMEGVDIDEIAKSVKVNRSTLWRWRTYNPNFIAALNQWRGLVYKHLRDRVLSIGKHAAVSVRQNVKDDGRLGLVVLDKLGLMQRGPDTPVDPYEIFGGGIDDTTGRHASSASFATVRQNMTEDQCRRATQLLALGAVVENQRVGRRSSRELMECAGIPSGQIRVIEAPGAGGESFEVEGPGLQNAQPQPADDPGEPACTIEIKASMTRLSSKGISTGSSGTYRVRSK